MSELITLRQAVDLIDLEQLNDVNADNLKLANKNLLSFFEKQAKIGNIKFDHDNLQRKEEMRKTFSLVIDDNPKPEKWVKSYVIDYANSFIDKASFIKWAKSRGFKLLSDETAEPENETAPKNKRGQHWEIKRAEIKGIAKALLAFNPELCTDDKGNITAVKIWASINDHAHKFWSSGEPPIKDQNSARKAISEVIKELGLDKK